MPDAFIYDHVRTPRGRGKPDGSLHEVPTVELAATALRAIRDRNGLDTPLIVWNTGDPDVEMKVKVAGGSELHPCTFLVCGQHRREALCLFQKRNSAKFDELFPEGCVFCIVRGDEGKAGREQEVRRHRTAVPRRDHP